MARLWLAEHEGVDCELTSHWLSREWLVCPFWSTCCQEWTTCIKFLTFTQNGSTSLVQMPLFWVPHIQSNAISTCICVEWQFSILSKTDENYTTEEGRSSWFKSSKSIVSFSWSHWLRPRISCIRKRGSRISAISVTWIPARCMIYYFQHRGSPQTLHTSTNNNLIWLTPCCHFWHMSHRIISPWSQGTPHGQRTGKFSLFWVDDCGLASPKQMLDINSWCPWLIKLNQIFI